MTGIWAGGFPKDPPVSEPHLSLREHLQGWSTHDFLVQDISCLNNSGCGTLFTYTETDPCGASASGLTLGSLWKTWIFSVSHTAATIEDYLSPPHCCEFFSFSDTIYPWYSLSPLITFMLHNFMSLPNYSSRFCPDSVQLACLITRSNANMHCTWTTTYSGEEVSCQRTFPKYRILVRWHSLFWEPRHTH